MKIKRLLSIFANKVFGAQKINDIKESFRSRMILKHGDSILRMLSDYFEKKNTDYWLIFGSLLGAYREHGFIKHDDDIDLAMFCSDITANFIKDMEGLGLTFVSVKSTNDGVFRMASFKYKSIVLDFYGFNLNKDNTITGFSSVPLSGKTYGECKQINKYGVYLINYPYEGLKSVKFNDYFVRIPVNTPYILEGLYGLDYMTPIKGEKGYESKISVTLPEEKCYASIISVDAL